MSVKVGNFLITKGFLNQDDFTDGVYTLLRDDESSLDLAKISSVAIINFSELECTFTPTFDNYPHPDNPDFTIRMSGSSHYEGNFPTFIETIETDCTDFEIELMEGPA